MKQHVMYKYDKDMAPSTVEEPNATYQHASTYQVTDYERQLILRGEADYKAGCVHTQAEVDKMMEAWLR